MMRRVLFVCLGNICRSPTAEGVLRAIAAREFPGLALDIDSAGTADYHVGEPPDRRTVAAARRRGYDLAGLRARQVQPEDFRRFDYLLAMDHANLAELEAAAAAGRVGASRAVPRVRAASGDAEVPDPYYGGTEDFEHVLDLCESAARGLLKRLGERQRAIKKRPARLRVRALIAWLASRIAYSSRRVPGLASLGDDDHTTKGLVGGGGGRSSGACDPSLRDSRCGSRCGFALRLARIRAARALRWRRTQAARDLRRDCRWSSAHGTRVPRRKPRGRRR